jgi:hypothetical protein
LETFASPRQFVQDPNYPQNRQRVLASFDPESIDAPIRELVVAFTKLPYCFTLQSCYGHFVHAARGEPDNVAPAPEEDVGVINYRIAYIAFCVENSKSGRNLCSSVKLISAIDPDYVQFGSPRWFWDRYPNSYALQVEPVRYSGKDVALIDHREALHVERVRALVFSRLARLLDANQNAVGPT